MPTAYHTRSQVFRGRSFFLSAAALSRPIHSNLSQRIDLRRLSTRNLAIFIFQVYVVHILREHVRNTCVCVR